VKKIPNMVVFWADTRKPLTYAERKNLEFKAIVVSVTPQEILLELRNGKTKKVAICGLTDPRAPALPCPLEP
jgi:hypothetical protein